MIIEKGDYVVCTGNTMQLMRVKIADGAHYSCRFKQGNKIQEYKYMADELILVDDVEDFLRQGGRSDD